MTFSTSTCHAWVFLLVLFLVIICKYHFDKPPVLQVICTPKHFQMVRPSVEVPGDFLRICNSNHQSFCTCNKKRQDKQFVFHCSKFLMRIKHYSVLQTAVFKGPEKNDFAVHKWAIRPDSQYAFNCAYLCSFLVVKHFYSGHLEVLFFFYYLDIKPYLPSIVKRPVRHK